MGYLIQLQICKVNCVVSLDVSSVQKIGAFKDVFKGTLLTYV